MKKAQELINKYLQQDKEDSSAWSLKGRIEYQLKNIDEGIKATLISYKIDPYNSQTCNNLGIFYKSKNDLLNAIRYLTEAIEVDPYNTGALTNLAISTWAKRILNNAGQRIWLTNNYSYYIPTALQPGQVSPMLFAHAIATQAHRDTKLWQEPNPDPQPFTF